MNMANSIDQHIHQRSAHETSAQYIDWVLDQLSGLYGAPFIRENQVRAASGDLVLGDRSGQWAAELAQVPPHHLSIGLSRCRARIQQAYQSGEKTWSITPAQFAAACQPTAEDCGLPSDESAWLMACSGAHNPRQVPVQAVRLAADGLWYEIRHATGDAAVRSVKKRFVTMYRSLVNRVIAGEELAGRALIEDSSSTREPDVVPVINRIEMTAELKSEAQRIKEEMALIRARAKSKAA